MPLREGQAQPSVRYDGAGGAGPLPERRWIGAVLAAVTLASPRPGLGADHRLTVGGGRIDVSITGSGSLPEPALLRWIDNAARGVTAYFGRYPVPQVRLRVRTGTSGGVGHGITHGGRVPSIGIQVGRAADESDLRDDWVLTHEMVHLAFPDLVSDDAWAEEGLATYVEPLARARLGLLSEDEVWSGLISELPKGLPRRGDQGLHGTEDWGRTYWGGALFWLIADVRIREKTGNRRGLPDALAEILDAGGDIRANWGLLRALDAGDRALGLTVLSDLYRELGVAPGTPDLAELWRRLGVRRVGGRVLYDNSAALAHVRRAIVGAPLVDRNAKALPRVIYTAASRH